MSADVTDAAAVLTGLSFELAQRRRIDAIPEVLTVQAEGRVPGLPGGSISVVSGDRRSRLVRDVRRAARRQDAAAVALAILAYEQELERKAARSPTSAGEQLTFEERLARLPVITQVTYRGKPVAEGLVVAPDEVDAVRVLVPFAGGELDAAGFTASSYVRDDDAPAVDTIILIRQPELSDLERKVLERLPRELSQLTVGSGDIAIAPGLLATVFAKQALLAAGALFFAGRAQAQQEQQQQQQQERAAQEQQQQPEQQIQQQEQQEEQQADDDAAVDVDDDANGGRLERLLGRDELVHRLDGLDAEAAVSTLVRARTRLMLEGSIR